MKFNRKSKMTLVPVVEGLEPRWLLSATIGPAFWGSAPMPGYAAQGPAVQATPTPGTNVTAQVGGPANGRLLLVVGTNGADTITLTQTASSITLSSAVGTYTYAGAFTGVTVYGFAGDDTIRVSYSVSAAVNVQAGDGNDTIFDLGRGADMVYAGNGNDTVISFDSLTRHQVFGEAGTDTFWVDAKTDATDVAAAESSGGYFNRISSFYGGVSMTISGQALADPSLTSYASRYASFASQPLFTDGPTYTDIRQGALGDCYLLASLASIADANPTAIRQAVTSLGDGTYAVRYYRNGSPTYLRVDADLPVTSGGSLVYARASGSGEVWAPVMEKAYAFFRTGANSYASIEGGWMADVDTQVTNHRTQTLYSGVSDATMHNFIKTNLSSGVTLGSKSNASGPVVGSHAYMVKSVSLVNGVMYVTVYNPWGYDGSSGADSNPNDGLVTLTIAQVRQYFTAAVAIV